MGILVGIGLDGAGRQFPLDSPETVIGRALTSGIRLEGTNISRRHARVLRFGNDYFLEDLGSSNGTYLNEKRVSGTTPLGQNDVVRVGSYALRFEAEHETDTLTIAGETVPHPKNTEIFCHNSARKLQAVLQLAHDLSNTLDTDALLGRFLDQAVKLLAKADRALAIIIENGEPRVRCMRELNLKVGKTFSRSIFKKVIEKDTALLATDTRMLDANNTLLSIGVRSLLCVPFQAQNAPPFGAVLVECFRPEEQFTQEDLNLLTAITLQASMALEKARMHQKLIVQERIERELTLAREVQSAFLPVPQPRSPDDGLELWGHLQPAVEVSGDFYDFFAIDERKTLIAVGDVSGKGMPAALFMSMVRALQRQVSKSVCSPAAIITELNDSVARENPTSMFVTLLVGVYDRTTRECVFARAGHAAPLLRTSDGVVSEIASHPGCLVGIAQDCPPIREQTIRVDPGDTLIFYTDGVTEAVHGATGRCFGVNRLLRLAATAPLGSSLADYGAAIRLEIDAFCAPALPEDDVTLLMLRHRP